MKLLLLLPLLLLLLLLLGPGPAATFRPVVIVHGILDGPKEFQAMKLFIQEAHPGTPVFVISLYNDLSSLRNMWRQVRDFSRTIGAIMRRAPLGIHLICFSQGGLICRALLATLPDHNVHTFISLSSPLAGQYGDTSYLKRVFPASVKKTVYKVCYKKVGQKISICAYWNDPHHRLLYLKGNNFLPLINGEVPHGNMTAWRDSFLRIKQLVLIGGPDDDVITPWQSSQFGFYDSSEQVVLMRKQEYYRNDTFGLRTLEAGGGVAMCTQNGVRHVYWHNNYTVFTNCIEKWLT